MLQNRVLMSGSPAEIMSKISAIAVKKMSYQNFILRVCFTHTLVTEEPTLFCWLLELPE
jgi:hypothetical protein